MRYTQYQKPIRAFVPASVGSPNDYFEYVGFGQIEDSNDSKNDFQYPQPGYSKTRSSTVFSKFVHKLFNTYGRAMFFPSHVAVGCVIQKNED